MTCTTRSVPAHRARRSGVSVAASIGQFTAAGLVVVLALAATTGLLARRAGGEQARQTFEQLASVSAAALHPALDGALAGDGTARAELGRQVAAVRAAGPVERVRVWGADGTLLWADDPRLVGRTFALTDDERRALREGSVGAGDPAPGVPGDPGRALDAYAGLRTASGQQVLVDLAEPWDAVQAPDREAWLRVTVLALGGLVLLELLQMPLAWRLARRLRRSQDAEAELLEATVTASGRERRRIAADLHDHVVQDLTGLAYDLDAARLRGVAGPPDVELLLGRTATRVRAGIDELRGVLVSLQAPHRPAGGLGARLTALGADLEQDGLQVSVRTDGVDRIPAPAAETVHRAAREALRNVRSHSCATHVELTVRCEGGWAEMVVEDDGRGFYAGRLAERTAQGHLGLRALGDLLAGAGGALTAASAPGEGTRLTVRVPLDAVPAGVPR